MTCAEARLLIYPYVDGELDLSRSLEIEEHLNGCAACASEAAAVRALSAGIGEGAHHYQAPARLENRILAMVRAKSGAAQQRRFSSPRVEWGLIAAAAAVAFVVMLFKGSFLSGGPGADQIAREVVADHVRSLMVDHLTDVISSNQHTVKPWFEGKLDFSPVVEDLTPQGFKLVGGRLDYLGGRPVAAIVYKRRAHVINVFVWPQHEAVEAPVTIETRDGYNVAHWTAAGMTYWAASSLNIQELKEFVADLRRPLPSESPPPANPPSSPGGSSG
ncbi:MAG: anti-sigma factor family protein [Candidatus Binataceae bacterium]